jgi:ribonuclease BN (tRNA processing enzyme)
MKDYEDEGLKVYMLGTGNAFSKERNNTSFIIDSIQKYMVDCPRALLQTLDKAGIDVKDINDVILTHNHGDHKGDLETLIFQKYYNESNKKLNIYTTKEIFNDLVDSLETSTHKPIRDYVCFLEIKPYQLTGIGNFILRARENLHSIPTIGFLIKHNGKKMGYSSDTRYDPEYIKQLYESGKISEQKKNALLEFFWDADVILHEADSTASEIHTDVKQLEALPEDVKKKIRLVHVPDNLETELKILDDFDVFEV